jgi:signal transduction histidine kinase
MSLQQMLDVSTNAETIKELNGFLQEEFCIRCAERICMMEERIPNFYQIPEFVKVYEKHILGFQEMQDRHASLDFLPVVRKIVNRGQDVVSLMCRGMARLLQTTNDMDETFVNTFMNEFLLNRIGSNVLMSQYLAVATGDDPPHPTSIINPLTNVTQIVKDTARAVQQLCYTETGYRPTIKVESYMDNVPGDVMNFPFIPAVISFILQELLKNSAVATATKVKHNKTNSTPNRHHHNNKPSSSLLLGQPSKSLVSSSSSSSRRINATDETVISVVICADAHRVMIHIGDHAGGIPFTVTQHVWSYLYTTKEKQKRNQHSSLSQGNDDDGHDDNSSSIDQDDKQDDSSSSSSLEARGATELGGYGVGLPLSRLYANYLGGNINLISLPGHGTHGYVFFPRLPEKMVESVPIRKTGWKANQAYNPEFIL